MKRRIAILPAAAGAAFAIMPRAAAAQTPMSYLRTFGPAGDPVTQLGWGLGIVAIAVMVIVSALLLWGVLRRRPRPADPRDLTVRSDSGGMSWIYIGIGLTTAVLVGSAIWTMTTLAAIAMPAPAAGPTVQVTASQWWWALRYADSDPAQVFTGANEIHIPVGRPVRVELNSIDVIHSFWIPGLAGKMDVIPGQTNVMWLQAEKPGIYRGQCGEYCGAQHAHMAMSVIADEPASYAAWRSGQVRAAPPPSSPATQTGERLFTSRCAACHTVRGTGAGGILGPDLTHLMSRHTLAAGLLPNTPGNLAAWISNPQSLKPGTRMPAPVLSPAELQSVVAYLDTLK